MWLLNVSKARRRSVVFIWLLTAGFFFSGLAVAESKFYAEGDVVVNSKTGLKWARCSLGQTWTGELCAGEVARMSVEDALAIARKFNEENGTYWRLPTRKELETLVCEPCSQPKIDLVMFPGTSAEPYWTGQSNNYVKVHNWSVNFFTGHSYGRFYPNQSLAVRLVQTF